jgi:hypothetical protein
VFDGEIGDAAARVNVAVSAYGLAGAGCQASAASQATATAWFVGGDMGVEDDGGEENI